MSAEAPADPTGELIALPIDPGPLAGLKGPLRGRMEMEGREGLGEREREREEKGGIGRVRKRGSWGNSALVVAG